MEKIRNLSLTLRGEICYYGGACSEGKSFGRNDELDKAQTEMSDLYPAFLFL